jgi:hypothetical protein
MPVRVLFQDEGRFGRINDTRRCWAPLPMRPVVRHQIVREYVYSFAAISPGDGRFSSLTMPWVNAQTMSIFLAHTAQEFAGDFCVMFLDGAGWHHAQDLVVPPTMRLIFLPPYSPELNPVEHVWEYLRESHFGNDALESLDEVTERLSRGFRELDTNPQLLQKMTQFDWIKTIILTSN